MLKPIIKNSKITIAFHCIWMIKTKLPLIDIQSLLLVDSCLLKSHIQLDIKVHYKDYRPHLAGKQNSVQTYIFPPFLELQFHLDEQQLCCSSYFR